MAKIIRDDEPGKLEKDALIYQQRDDTDSRAEYEKLDKKGKFQFFKDYYLKTIAIIVALVVAGGAYLYHAMTKPQTALYIAIADDAFDAQQVKKLEKAVETYLNFDTKHQVVEINTNFSFRNGELSRQLQTYIYSGDCDVVIASEEGFQSWAQVGYFLEPDTSDVVSFYRDREEKDRLYTQVINGEQMRGEKEKDETEYNFGISVKDCEKYKALKGVGLTAYAGIPNSSKRQEEAAAFLQFLLDDSLKDGDVNPNF